MTRGFGRGQEEPSLSSSSSYSNASANPAVPQAVPTPKVPTEKEKMAAALFGGMTSASTATAAQRKRASAPSVAPPVAPVYSPPVAELIYNSTPPVAAVPQTSAPPASTNSLFDLLDTSLSSTGASVSQSSAAPAPHSYGSPVQFLPPAFASSTDLLTPMAFAPPPVPTFAPPIPTAPTQPTASRATVSDAFAEMDLSPSSGAVLSFSDMNISNNNNITSISNMSVSSTTGTIPLSLTTAEFGQKWSRTQVELKKGFHCRIRGLDQLRVSMPSSYSHVESIPHTSEAIYAASTAAGGIVLVHIKLFIQKTHCDITVKSGLNEVCQQEMSVISAAISS
jgi:hypothetical protein